VTNNNNTNNIINMPPYWVMEECQAMESTQVVKKPETTEDSKQDEQQPVLPDSSTPTTRTSKIQFDMDATSVYEVCGRHEMSPDDLKMLFYRATEYANICSWNRMTVNVFGQRAREGSMMESSSSAPPAGGVEDDGHCIRGLEHRVKSQHRIHQQIKMNSVYSVLEEQDRQRRAKYRIAVDVDKVAEVYRSHTHKSYVDAYKLGLEDERIVKELEDKALAELVGVKGETQSHGRQMRRRTLIRSFDDNDLRHRKDDYSANEASFPRMTPRKGTDEKEDEESFHSKAKHEGRLMRFFRRVSHTSSSSSSKTSPSHETNIEKEPAASPRSVQHLRRLRRSSM
jgi:hypothetical protein